ncbi:MAG: 2-phosphosulfolactate phosphatase family protein [Candidatus Caldatribacteriota bacterium]
MKDFEVILTPEEIDKKGLNHKLVIVIDVLRASSTIITALVKGSKGIIPVFNPEEAQQKKYHFKTEEILLGGERKGKKIKGFDLGNSPLEYLEEVVRDKLIIFSTTNGVKTLERVKNAQEVIIGSFLNLKTVADYCINFPEEVLLVCAGKEGKISLEDTTCAGMLINNFQARHLFSKIERDSNLLAHLLYEKFGHNILKMLQVSEHGRYLCSLGYLKDLEFCAQTDIFNVLPFFQDGIIYL